MLDLKTVKGNLSSRYPCKVQRQRSNHSVQMLYYAARWYITASTQTDSKLWTIRVALAEPLIGLQHIIYLRAKRHDADLMILCRHCFFKKRLWTSASSYCGIPALGHLALSHPRKCHQEKLPEMVSA